MTYAIQKTCLGSFCADKSLHLNNPKFTSKIWLHFQRPIKTYKNCGKPIPSIYTDFNRVLWWPKSHKTLKTKLRYIVGMEPEEILLIQMELISN